MFPITAKAFKQNPIFFKYLCQKILNLMPSFPELLYYFREINNISMDWINCNSCCRQPGDERERTFALSSCGHIFCDLCLAQGTVF